MVTFECFGRVATISFLDWTVRTVAAFAAMYLVGYVDGHMDTDDWLERSLDAVKNWFKRIRA